MPGGFMIAARLYCAVRNPFLTEYPAGKDSCRRILKSAQKEWAPNK
jgi:hypothetical protein